MRITLIAIFFFGTISISAYNGEQPKMFPKTFNFEQLVYYKKLVTPEVERHTASLFQKHPEFGVNPYNTQCRNCFEVLQERQFDSRFFIKHGTDGGEFFVQKSATPIHYKDKKGN